MTLMRILNTIGDCNAAWDGARTRLQPRGTILRGWVGDIATLLPNTLGFTLLPTRLPPYIKQYLAYSHFALQYVFLYFVIQCHTHTHTHTPCNTTIHPVKALEATFGKAKTALKWCSRRIGEYLKYYFRFLQVPPTPCCEGVSL